MDNNLELGTIVFSHDKIPYHIEPSSDVYKSVSYTNSTVNPERFMSKYRYINNIEDLDPACYQDVKRMTADLLMKIADLKRELDITKKIADESGYEWVSIY